MVGRHLATFSAEAAEPGGVALSARGLGRRGEFSGIDLELRFGEVVGLAGLMGARRGELAGTLAGILAPHEGSIEIRGVRIRFRGLRDALAQGIAYVPEERKTDGLFLTRSLVENAVVTKLRRFTRFGLVDRRAARAAARRTMSRFQIRGPGVDAPVGLLSGGNQQKLMLAKWLEIDPAIILINEPTKGVDIEAKREIHQEIRTLARAGTAVLVISSDLPELFAVSDRIAVMREGRLVGTLAARATSEAEVMALAAGARHPLRGEAA
jgi:ABC-type sugar transport system ATPase subunit